MKKREAFTVRLRKRTAEDEREPVLLEGSRLFRDQERPSAGDSCRNLAADTGGR